MPWKFIVFIVIVIILAIFIGLNVNETARLNLLFGEIEGSSVIVVLVSFVAGGIIGVLASLLARSKKKRKAKIKNAKKQELEKAEPEKGEPDEGDPEPARGKGRGRGRR
jgi:uncharacterized integral membrane protein